MAGIQDVAKAAGVSISTVSYALSGKRSISPSTRRRIEQAVEDLGYRPNAWARVLAGSCTQIIALAVPGGEGSGLTARMKSVVATAAAARAHGYDVLLLTDDEATGGIPRVAATGLVDAIVLLDVTPDDERVAVVRSIALPSVSIGVPDDRESVVCVDLDREKAAAMVVDRLASAGHDSIGLIGRVDGEQSNPSRLRHAIEERCDRLGVRLHAADVCGPHTDREMAGRLLAEMLHEGVTALAIDAPEEVHREVLAAIVQRGLSIPLDLSVVTVGAAFDTSVLPVALDEIPLSSADLCTLAVAVAIQSLTPERPEPGVHAVPPSYIDRGSVATIERRGGASHPAVSLARVLIGPDESSTVVSTSLSAKK